MFKLSHPSIGPVSYGFSLTLASCIGQTFLISLFVPAVGEASGMSLSSLALLYSGATLLSGVLLFYVGRLVDRYDIGLVGLAAGVGAVIGCIFLANARHAIPIFVGMVLLRLFAQGLLPHVGMTGVARHMASGRGKALAIVGLGFSVGEAVLPILATTLIDAYGWRQAFAGIGIGLALVLVPAATLLIVGKQSFRLPPKQDVQDANGARGNTLWQSIRFRLYLPLLVFSPLCMTALLFLQTILAQEKGIDILHFTAGFVGYALAQFPASIVFGAIADRYGSHVALILHVVPLMVGAGLLSMFGNAGFAWVFLTLAGATAAGSTLLRTTLVADIVFQSELGRARASLAALLIFAAAAGPAIYGWLINIGYGIDQLLWLTTGLGCFAIGAGLLGNRMAST